MKSKKVEIPIYHGTLIIVCDNKWDEINEKYKIEIAKEFDAVSFKNTQAKHSEYVVALKKNMKPHVIAHEAVHIVNMIFIDIKMELDRYNDEAQAYLTGWVVNEIESFVNKK